jgi:transcriptional regulator with XRE-family HTH domain
MDTTNDPNDAFNTATAEIIDARKHELRMTYEELEAKSGVNMRTLKRLVTGERPFRMGQFFAVASALGLDPAEVMAGIESKVALQSKLENSSR